MSGTVQGAVDTAVAGEESFRQIVDSMPAFAWCASPDGKIEYLNRRIVDYTGERLETLVGFGWANVLHPQDVERTKKAWLHSIETGEPCVVDQRVRRFDKIYRWFRTVAQPLRDHSGRVIRWYGVATDIEDWKRTEEALRASEDSFRLIVDSIPGLVLTMTAEGELEFVSQQGLDYSGKTLHELKSWTTSDLVHPDDLSRVAATWRRSVETGHPAGYDSEYRLRRADGVYRWFQIRALPVRDSEGRVIRWYCLHTDIDDRKRVEEALRASEQSFRLIVDCIPGLVNTRTAEGEVEFVGQQTLAYFGKTLDELKGWALSDIAHPDDFSRVLAAWKCSIETGHPYDAEYRLRRADGAYRWFHVRALAWRDAEGRIARWYVLHTDIDERKQAEGKLKRSEASLAEAQRLSHCGSWSWNVTTRDGFWSQEMFRILGYDPEKTKPALSHFLERVHPEDRPMVEQVVKEEMTGLEADLPSDYRIVLSDRTVKHLHAVAHPVRNESGDVVEIIGTSLDVTEQRLARAELENVNEQLRKEILERTRAEDRLQLLLDVTNQVVSNLQLRDLLRAISGNIRRVMQCDLVGVFLPDSKLNRMQTFVLDFPESKGFIREEYCSMEGSLGGLVFRSGKPWAGNASDVLQLGLTDEPIIPESLKVGCMLPLVSRNRVLGLLGLGRREENAFSQVDLGFLTQVANQIAIAVENALEYGQMTEAKERLAEQKLYLEDEIRVAHNFEEIIGNSPRLKGVLESIRTVAPADSTVLIQGETGTGKELIARAIHNLSPRKGQAFVKVNCAAIPSGLLESELFGHEKGAFTGAIAQKIGRFELAHKGTLFLDEVGDIPLELQPKLLRILQEQEFERLGSTRTQRVDVRLLAATNASLTQMVAEKKFRSDLYYRLNVFPVTVPPLRDRGEDIPLLVRHFANKYARRMGKKIESIPKEAMEALSHYAWPGNIRELQNLMERAVLLSVGPSLRVPLGEILTGSDQSAVSRGNALEQAEREQIMRALRECNWVVGGTRGAAARLGLKRTSLAYKMQKLGISRPLQ
jgi:formate hydrogenlyase transcriptional activator